MASAEVDESRQHGVDVVDVVDVPAPDVAWLSLPAGFEPSAGTRVRAGDVVVGHAASSAAAVTPLAGELGGLESRTGHGAGPSPHVAVVVDDDAELADAASVAPPGEASQATREVLAGWVGHFARCGVRADRVSSPDLLRQLHAATRKPIDVVICHALEPDPRVWLQVQWLLRHAGQVAAGLALVSRLTGAGRTVLAVPESQARRVNRVWSRTQAKQVALAAPANSYPQSDPTLLVHTLAGRRLRPGRLPTEVGVVVLDAVAAWAVGEAAQGRVVRRQPVGLRRHDRDVGLLAEVWRGTPLENAAVQTGLVEVGESLAWRAGEFLRDLVVAPTHVLDGGELVYHATAPAPGVWPEPCIRCGWCLDICPTGVHPVGLMEASQWAADPRKAPRAARLAARYGGSACVGCGLCQHVCPSRLPLLSTALEGRRLAGS